MGQKLYLKGERCYDDNKCAVKRRPYPPGHLGRFSRRDRRATEYAKQLKEKQKARFMYGVSERQFRNYYELASSRPGITGEILFQTLERRLDNVVYRLGFGGSRREARQIVRHRHVTVNGRIVDIPSFLVKPNDVIEIKDKSKKMQRVRDAANANAQGGRIPAWLESNVLEFKGTVLELPTREKMEIPVEDHLIVEFYSR
jgi:small subunit ribosomal protein S4